MARQARQISKSGNYYVELHGQELYVSEADKERFNEIAKEKFSGGRVYGTEIEKTQIRLAVKEPENGISMAMKSLTTVYARYFNNANGREGKLFEGRFKSVPLESKKELDECLANLKTAAPKPKNTEKSRTAPAKTAKPKKVKEQTPEETPKIAPKKNLPSWLL